MAPPATRNPHPAIVAVSSARHAHRGSRLVVVIAAASAVLLVGGALASGAPALALTGSEEHSASHFDPFSVVLLDLGILLFAAVLGRWLAGCFHQPSVLGELLIGVLIGNLGLWLELPLPTLIAHLDGAFDLFRGVWLEGVAPAEAAQSLGLSPQIVEIVTGEEGPLYVMLLFALWLFSKLGVVLLIFMVGLESSIDEIVEVGSRAVLVALIGVVAPFLLGFAVVTGLLPDTPSSVRLFLGATLCATSVGITARVFRDLGKSTSREAKMILGAAVIDDVLGLLILAIVLGIAVTGEVDYFDLGQLLLLSTLFLLAMFVFGDHVARRIAQVFGFFDRSQRKILYPLTLACLLAWAVNMIGLATIVGAFAAGLLVREHHFQGTARSETVEELVTPLEAVFAPVFFVIMGMQVNLSAFTDLGTLGLGGALVVAAVVGKALSGWPAGPTVSRWAVGIGMIPRGEVGLIFASIGRGAGVVNAEIFSAVIVMVAVTTLMTPPLLKWSLRRDSGDR